MNFIPFSAEAAPSNSMEGRSGEKTWENEFYAFLGGSRSFQFNGRTLRGKKLGK